MSWLIYHATDVELTEENKREIEKTVGEVVGYERCKWLEPGRVYAVHSRFFSGLSLDHIPISKVNFPEQKPFHMTVRAK